MATVRMADLFEAARFRGMGGGASAAARDRMDAERAAKRKAEYSWRSDLRGKGDDPRQANKATLSSKYSDVAWITWWDDDEARDKFRAETAVPGVRGQTQVIGRFSSLEKAQAAAEKELGL
ncbi:MAG: hypothetical protein WC683_01915 [bacterium]